MKRTWKNLTSLAVLALSCSQEQPAFEVMQTGRVSLMVTAPTGENNQYMDIQSADAASGADMDAVFDDIAEEDGSAVGEPDTEDGGAEDDSTTTNDTDEVSDNPATADDGDASPSPTPTSTADSGTGNNSDSATDGGQTVTSAPTKAELSACAKLQGVAVERIKVVGNKSSLRIESNSFVAIKVAGNQSKLELNLVGGENARIGSICLFLAGNQSKGAISSKMPVGRFIYIGRGNQSETEFASADGATLEALNADLGGNAAKLTVSGDGSYPCQTVRLRGRNSEFTCQ